jgi:hypothetical protein
VSGKAMRTSSGHKGRPKTRGKSLTRRWMNALCLALYMTDPIRQGIDAELVAEYLGESESYAPCSTGRIT